MGKIRISTDGINWEEKFDQNGKFFSVLAMGNNIIMGSYGNDMFIIDKTPETKFENTVNEYQVNGVTINPVDKVLNIPVHESAPLEVYSESGTLAGGDAEATIGDLNFMSQTGNGFFYSQNMFGQGTFLINKAQSLILESIRFGIAGYGYDDTTNPVKQGIQISTIDKFIGLSDKVNAPELHIDYSEVDYNIGGIKTIKIPNKSGTTALENEEYTVATLPSTPSRGDKAFITDAISPTYLGVAVGGGSIFCEVMYNGTDWVTI